MRVKIVLCLALAWQVSGNSCEDRLPVVDLGYVCILRLQSYFISKNFRLMLIQGLTPSPFIRREDPGLYLPKHPLRQAPDR